MELRKDIYHALTVLRAISPKDGAGDNIAEVSQIIDMQGRSACLFLIGTGTVADAGATFTTLLEEGDDPALADNAAVADADMLGTEALASFTQANDDSVYKLGYIGTKRYIRLTITPAGNAAAWGIGVIAVVLPNTQPAA